jgi:hypothetical protein
MAPQPVPGYLWRVGARRRLPNRGPTSFSDIFRNNHLYTSFATGVFVEIDAQHSRVLYSRDRLGRAGVMGLDVR